MGGIAPILSQGLSAVSLATRAIGAFNTITDQSGRDEARSQAAAQDLALRQLQQQQGLQQKNLEAQTALDRQKIVTDAAQAHDERRAALRRAVARQRANFGSQGVGSGAGSSQAVLLGLFDESEEERIKREQIDALKTAALDQTVSQNQSLSLLQRAQLEERQRLARLF